MAVEIKYNNVNPFGARTPFVDQEVLRQESNGLISSVTRLTLNGTRPRPSCSANFSDYKADMDSLRTAFHSQFKPIEISENGNQLFYHSAAKVVSIIFPDSPFIGFYSYQIVLDCINSYQNSGILEPVDEWTTDEDSNGVISLTHTVSARGVGENALELAKSFVLAQSDGNYDLFLFLDDGSEQLFLLDDDETPVLLDSKNRKYPLISRKTFLNRLTGEFRMTESWVYHPENQGTNGVITYQTSVNESNGVATVEISGEIQVARIDVEQTEILKAKQTFDSIDFQAIAQSEYEASGGVLTLSNVTGGSVAQNADLGTVSFSLSWNSQKESSPYILDSSTVTINKTGGPNCFRYSGTVKVDEGCQRDRLTLAKNFFKAVNLDARVLQQWNIYGTGEVLTANPRSKSYSENPATGEVTFSAFYCADPEVECGAIEAFKYSMSWTPSINQYSANPIKEGGGFYDVQNLNFKNRQGFSIQGSAKRIKCFSLEAAKGEIRSRINLLMIKYFPAANRILLSSQIEEDKNGDFINFSFSWNADAD